MKKPLIDDKNLETEDIALIAAKDEILNNPIYSELIISPSGKTTAIQVTLKENATYRDLIRERYLLHDSDLTNKENVLLLKEVNKKISTINDEESRQRDILITNIRIILVYTYVINVNVIYLN